MKKIIIANLVLFLISFKLVLSQTSVQPEGTGTIDNPYQIENINNLYWLSENSSEWDKIYVQTADIDASETKEWDEGAGFSPIGQQGNWFSGIYDGMGHNISNLFIDRPDADNVGLFGYVYMADIKNIAVENADITGANSVAVLAGYFAFGDFYNCSANGTVNGIDNVGILAGSNVGSFIAYSLSGGTITSTGTSSGGLAGINRYGGIIYNSYSMTDVYGDSIVGGLVGNNYFEHSRKPKIINCYSTGYISGESDKGGLVGANTGDVTNSFWDMYTSGITTSDGGTGLWQSDMKDPLTFLNADWNMDYCWALDEQEEINSGYPYHIAPVIPDSEQPAIGDGTLLNPYRINNLGNLTWISLNLEHWDKHYIQTADINAGEYETEGWHYGYGFSPIGNKRIKFSGSYDGQNYNISNLFIKRNIYNNIGLFGNTSSANLENINLINVKISGGGSMAALAGLIEDSTIVYNCSSSGDISGISATDIGGLIGKSNSGSKINYSNSNATVNAYLNVGGLVGENYSSEIYRCFATGTVTADGKVGGLVGYNHGGNVRQCYYSGDVYAEVSGAGGLVGFNAYSGIINNCYSMGTVGALFSYVGGLVGECFYETGIYNSYSRSAVSGQSDLGGLISRLTYSNIIKNSFWDEIATGQTYSAAGTKKSSEEMKDVATYTNTATTGLTEAWDFVNNPYNDTEEEDIWNIRDDYNDGYPYLTWQCPLPIITGQPVNITACEGNHVGFLIEIEYSYSIEYQWQIYVVDEFIDIPEQNNYSLEISDVSLDNDGELYRCVLSTDCGFLYTKPATLNVSTPTEIIAQPENIEDCVETTVSFTVEATGGNLQYQWIWDEIVQVGDNSPTLIIENITGAEKGNYFCIVSGDCGEEHTQTVTLTVHTPTEIIAQPENDTVCQGDIAEFYIDAYGWNLSYQWKKNENNIDDATLNYLELDNVSEDDIATYICVVTGNCGSVTSQDAVLELYQDTGISIQPQNADECEGDDVTFMLEAVGYELTYLWKKNDAEEIGDNSNVIYVNNITSNDGGTYICEVSGKCGTVLSNEVTLSVLPLTEIIVHPEDVETCIGESVSFIIEAVGVNLQYQWKKNGTMNVGFNTSVLTFNHPENYDAGIYSCEVTGQCGTQQISDEALLTILPFTFITLHPQETSQCVGLDVEFSVEVTGAYLQYTWKKFDYANTTTVGIDSSALIISNISAEDNAFYYCEVTGQCGNHTSESAYLTVLGTDINTSLTQQGEHLQANQHYAQYQWVDCNDDFAHITGEINREFTATENGYYAVLISYSGCTIISDCYNVNNLSVGTFKYPDQPVFYPNPTNGLIWIDYKQICNADIKIRNILGKIVIESQINGQGIIPIDISHCPTGLYIIEIISEKNVFKANVVKK